MSSQPNLAKSAGSGSGDEGDCDHRENSAIATTTSISSTRSTTTSTTSAATLAATLATTITTTSPMTAYLPEERKQSFLAAGARPKEVSSAVARLRVAKQRAALKAAAALDSDSSSSSDENDLKKGRKEKGGGDGSGGGFSDIFGGGCSGRFDDADSEVPLCDGYRSGPGGGSGGGIGGSSGDGEDGSGECDGGRSVDGGACDGFSGTTFGNADLQMSCQAGGNGGDQVASNQSDTISNNSSHFLDFCPRSVDRFGDGCCVVPLGHDKDNQVNEESDGFDEAEICFCKGDEICDACQSGQTTETECEDDDDDDDDKREVEEIEKIPTTPTPETPHQQRIQSTTPQKLSQQHRQQQLQHTPPQLRQYSDVESRSSSASPETVVYGYDGLPVRRRPKV